VGAEWPTAAEVFAGIINTGARIRYTALVPNLAGLNSIGRWRQAHPRTRGVRLFPTENPSQASAAITSTRASTKSLASYAQVFARLLASGLERARAISRTSFGCPFEWRSRRSASPPEAAARWRRFGVFEVAIHRQKQPSYRPPRAGSAGPRRRAGRALPAQPVACPLRYTRHRLAIGLGSLPYGIATSNAAPAVFGGCPYAPGAAGNLATDDLIYMLDGPGGYEN